MADRDSLILAHEWVVRWAVRRSGRALERQEAWQEGWVALVAAAAEWDGRGRFAAFAAPRVRVAIRRALRRRDRVWRAERADEHIAGREGRPAGADVGTAVKAAMAEVLDESERAAIRRHYWGGGGGDGRERKLRRRAEAKLREFLAG